MQYMNGLTSYLLTMDLLSFPYAGSWLPSQVVKVVTRFARHLNQQ